MYKRQTYSVSPTQSETFTETPTFSITATSSRTLSGVVNVGIVDARGVIEPQVTIKAVSLSYVAELRTAASLAAGSYSGHLEVRLCRDTPSVCAQPVEGSPWSVPYRFTVLAATNATPLTPLAGAGAWSTYQGNAAHTGHVDAAVQAANFNRRWVVPAQVGSLAVEDGRVIVAPPGNQFGAVVALAEHDGAQQWRFGSSDSFSGVASGGGRVWFMHQALFDPQLTTHLRSLDAGTGQTQSAVAVSQFSRPERLAPVVLQDSVFLAADGYNSISRHLAADGSQQWQAIHPVKPNAAIRWTPAVGGGRALMFDYHRLWWADATTGAALGSIDGPNLNNASGIWTVSGAPVLGSGSLVYVTAYYDNGFANGAGRLVAFDLATQTVAWNVGTTVRSNPVLAGNVVYVVVTGRALQAHDAGTGALLWRWDAPALPPSTTPEPSPTGVTEANQPLVAVGNLAFVGLGDTTYAVDLGTQRSVWQYPAAGPMAVSANGTLFIGTADKLHAINLR